MIRKNCCLLIINVFCLCFLFVSCNPRSGDILQKELLFELRYGKTEDQMNIFPEPGQNSLLKDRILMENGLFYISNGQSQKIMEFNSYGDIIYLYFNNLTNPEPVLLQVNEQDSVSSTRNVYHYPFIDIGEIGLTRSRMLLADDRIVENRIEHDRELGVLLDRIILQFDSRGNFLDYLGQEGPGGTPFPLIDKIRVTDNDEIVIFTVNPRGWRIFWFSPEGKPLFTRDIFDDSLPFPSKLVKDSGYYTLETIDCSNTERLLYIKADYFIDYTNVLETERTGTGFSSSQIITLDVEKNAFINLLEIPGYIQTETRPGNLNQENRDLIYEFVGLTGKGTFFLMCLNGVNAYNLMIVDQEGRVYLRRNIVLGNEHLNFKEFNISNNGILTALISWEDRVEVSWWRTDTFLTKEEQ